MLPVGLCQPDPVSATTHTVNRVLPLLLIATACRGCDGGERAQHPGSGSAILPPLDAAAVAEPPPPGTDKLDPGPAGIAAKVALKEIAHRLPRPVLLAVAAGDERERFFLVEQRGAIR